MKKYIIPALKSLLAMTVLTGIAYPLLMTGIAQVIFPNRSNGSLILREGKAIGSRLIGQKFDSSIYFWSRPSAVGYNPFPSGASNYGPTSDTLRKLASARRDFFAEANSINDKSVIPTEMLLASGSGLDPDISPEAAMIQVNRISEARHFDLARKAKTISMIRELTEPRPIFIPGRARINVLMLNIELDKIDHKINSKD